jgi:hypothetical protein
MSRRYRAPSRNGDLLIDPPFDAVPELIEENRKKLDRDDVRIGGVSLRELRLQVRKSGVLPQTPPATVGKHPAPIIITGHQPEIFHPGVWVKNFAAAGLARRLNGHSVHLTVDNDVVHSANLTVLHYDTNPANVGSLSVSYDSAGQDTIFESRPLLERELFNTMPDRLAGEWIRWPFRPLLPDLWQKVIGPENLGALVASLRYPIEAELGCISWCWTVSGLTSCDPWLAFTRHLLADAARFAAVHNAALVAYRRENKLRSRTHPFPDLAQNEAPFWVLDEDGKRNRCFVPYTGDPKSLRPRALTLTLFARLILGDFFIHGIGGAKYDEVTDRVIRDYFGIDPPAYQVVTGTLHLPFPLFPHTADDVKRLEHIRRDLDWNPHRHLTAEQRSRPEVTELLARRELLAAAQPRTKDSRRQHFRDQRAVVDGLRPFVANRVAEVERELAVARTEAAANAVLTRRDYAWVLYPREELVPFLQSVQALAVGK